MKTSGLAATLAGSLLSLAVMFPANGQDARTEIEALLDRLQASKCQFRRNGQWHGGGLAREHLGRKLGFLLKQNPRLSVKEFIAQAASGSSATQQPYKVRCVDSPEMYAADWLSQQLKSMRASRGPGTG